MPAPISCEAVNTLTSGPSIAPYHAGAMSESDAESGEQVDRRAFLSGAGKASVLGAALSGGLMGWALQRAGAAEAQTAAPHHPGPPATAGQQGGQGPQGPQGIQGPQGPHHHH